MHLVPRNKRNKLTDKITWSSKSDYKSPTEREQSRDPLRYRIVATDRLLCTKGFRSIGASIFGVKLFFIILKQRSFKN